jgi:hypothetical protein
MFLVFLQMQLRPAADTVYLDVRSEEVAVVDVPSDDDGPVFRARGGVVKAHQEMDQASRPRKATRGRQRLAPGSSPKLDIQEFINKAMATVPDDRLAEVNVALSKHNHVVSAEKDEIQQQEEVIEEAQNKIELSREAIKNADEVLRKEIVAILEATEDDNDAPPSSEGEIAANRRDAVRIFHFYLIHSLILQFRGAPFVYTFYLCFLAAL